MVFDTDVLIWLLRGNEKAARIVDATGDREVSVVTYMELLQGSRNREESHLIKRILSDLAFTMLPLSENIGHRAAIYMEEYGLSTGMHMADALLAATAIENRLSLCSGNQRHYRPIKDLGLRPFLP